MQRGSGTFGLGEVMLAVALLALVLGAARASVPLGVAIAAILGMAAHRVRAVLRPERAAGRPVGFGRLAGAWARSVACAVQVVFFAGLVGVLTLFAGFPFGALVGGVLRTVLGPGIAGRIEPAVMLLAAIGALGAMGWAASLVRRALWPGPDGRLPWQTPAGPASTRPEGRDGSPL
jgi:hypothetical protein